MGVVSCSYASDRKFYANLTITEIHRASTDMEFWVNSTSLILTVPLEFVFNILILNFSGLVNGL